MRILVRQEAVPSGDNVYPAAVNVVISGLGFLATNEPDRPKRRVARKEDF
jgi:hypothetical protein